MQTAGAGIVYWYGLPLYRQTVADPMGFEPRPLERSAVALAAVTLIQVPYWIGQRVRLALLFSLFCYTLELERLGTALRGKHGS